MKYKVSWATKVSMGCTYYSGVEIVDIEEGEENEAESIAINNIWKKGFKDFPKNHIQAKSVKMMQEKKQ